jgi:hypothetical protein
MKTVERRKFLSQFSCTVGAALIPFSVSTVSTVAQSQDYKERKTKEAACWLDVTSPFIVEDSEIGIHSEIVLTSDTFCGSRGHEDGVDSTEYEIYLYDSNGKAIGPDGVAKRLTVPAMQTTVFSLREILGKNRNFFGGMKIRLRPGTRTPMHASDLFSSAFLRLTTDSSFDSVHANPDPLQWQRAESFFYSMPFPPLNEYRSLYAIFNPYSERSQGSLRLYDHHGKVLNEASYDLKPQTSLLFDLRAGGFVKDVRTAFGLMEQKPHRDEKISANEGGTIAITNHEGSVKNFGYLFIKHPERPRFSIDHPIHQSSFPLVHAKAPFDADGRFKAKNVLYTPLLFRSKKIGGVTLDSRFHLSSGSPIEEFLWLSPFVTDSNGGVAWQPTDRTKLPSTISARQLERGAIKLAKYQSCILDPLQLDLPQTFSGGLSLAIAPLSNHTLMKVEVRVAEWGAHAFTHFRPGLSAARAYQKPTQRGGLATDYITTGARFERSGTAVFYDEIICVINIDDKGISGQPILEVFSRSGLMTRVNLGDVPGFACRSYLLSTLLSGKGWPSTDLSLRLVDEQATLLMSAVHLDHLRRDIALDHGSDRFSTFQDFNCDVTA